MTLVLEESILLVTLVHVLISIYDNSKQTCVIKTFVEASKVVDEPLKVTN